MDGHLTCFQIFALIGSVADKNPFPFLFAAPCFFQSFPFCHVIRGKVTLLTVPGISTKESNPSCWSLAGDWFMHGHEIQR